MLCTEETALLFPAGRRSGHHTDSYTLEAFNTVVSPDEKNALDPNEDDEV